MVTANCLMAIILTEQAPRVSEWTAHRTGRAVCEQSTVYHAVQCRKAVDMRCEGKVVLVTGAQRGIGRAVALRFAHEGANVALNFLDDKPAAESGAAQIAALGRRCCVIQADIAKAV